MKARSDSIDIIKILLAVVVAVIALLVRMPSAFLVAVSEEAEEAYTDDTGLPYFSDPDSYYHIRLVDTMLRTGKIADTTSPDGEPWDTHSFYPEGRSAAYEPGIVYLTIALWKVFNLSTSIDISRVEYYLAGFMAMFTALAAYITGCRINGKISGGVAGVLMSCAPDFVARTSFGRFDTDIFVILMNALLILFLVEMLRENVLKKQLAFAGAYILIAMVYANCWAAKVSMLFVGLTIAGGMLFVAIESMYGSKEAGIRERIVRVLTRKEMLILLVTGIMILLIIGVTMGFYVVSDIFQTLFFDTTQGVSEGILPNMYESISELEIPALVPPRFTDWFRGYVIGSPSTVITGIGGAFVAIAAIGGLVLLFLRFVGKLGVGQNETLQRRDCLMCFVILGLWTVVGLYLTRSGMRFIEILTVPLSLLAGIFVGMIPGFFKPDSLRWRIAGVVTTLIISGIILFPDMKGFLLSVKLPSVTDASANTMEWIKSNSDDTNAVVESWWDMGYYYESESGLPCLWDGGSQDPIRAILFSRAMVENDMEMSWRILSMLASSGNRAVDMLMEYTDPKNAFDVLWDVLPMEEQDACNTLSEKCGMRIEDAKKAEKLIHPCKSNEMYLVITNTMMRQTEVYEYYSNWDFTGTQIPPFASEDPGAGNELTEEEQEESERLFEEQRNDEVMWRLFVGLEDNPYFIPECEFYDGVEGIRVWRLTPI